MADGNLVPDGDGDDDVREVELLRGGIGNSRQMWTATWQGPTTARATIVIFNIFILRKDFTTTRVLDKEYLPKDVLRLHTARQRKVPKM